MFRRLEEAFQDHPEYVNKQNTYFNALPNMILSQTSGLKGFDTAIQSLDSRGTNYQRPPVKNPDSIFIQDSSPNLNNLAKECASSSLDELITIKNPNAAIGCGWLYTPPNKNSPYPIVSQGFIGNPEGPLQGFNPPNHKKYFFDLQLAKKQMLLDKCKALQTCTGVDDEIYRGTCGYCTDTNQGIPIDNGGRALYSDNSIGTCSPASIVRTSSKCPAPASADAGSGPEPNIDRTCEPVNGRLSAACLYNQVISAGCSDKGALATALANPSSSSNYINSITSGDTVKIYNRVANPPLNLDIFAQGITTVESVLKETRQLVGNTKEPPRSALGSSARELCLQSGSIAAYDFCDDLQDSTAAPFDLRCLQKLFRKMGGQPTGKVYPTASTMALYNSMSTIGNVKQYLNKLIEDMNSGDYATQKTAVLQFLGISLQSLITRVPYRQGVEVIWFQSVPGKWLNSVGGILRRTIESDIVQSVSGGLPKRLQPNTGPYVASGMIQIFDFRSNINFSTKYRISTNGGFIIATNQPANVAKTALNSGATDQEGLLANYNVNGNNTYISEKCANYFSGTPNITKIFYTNVRGPSNNNNTLQLSNAACKDSVPNFIPAYYSLTLDIKAPYLNFEVSPDGNTFDDTRNPGLFLNIIVQNGAPEFHNRSEERNNVPGRKGFVRISNKTSWIRLQNIAYQAWGSVTFAFRLQSMPVKDTIFSFWSSNKSCILYLVPSGSSAQMRIRTDMTMNNAVSDTATNFNISIGKWYLLRVTQNGTGLDINCDMIENIIKNNKYTTSTNRIIGTSPITTSNNSGLGIPGQTNCSVSIAEWLTGLPGYAQSLIFDLAWVHFYDHYDPDVVKDSKAAWQFTQYPDSPNTYRTLN
jgi:hypothetical protein